MSEMTERVAKAIEEKMFEEQERPIDPVLHRIYLGVARAAIEAMREPTVVMLANAYRHVGIPERPIFADAWRTMIDAALVTSQDRGAP